jgi:NADH-quinone oxidoreductase subunit C
VIGADATALCRERFGLEVPREGPLVPRERLVELARALKDELGYHYLVYVTATHHLESKDGESVRPARFVVVYRVRNLASGAEFPFRCEVPVGTPVPTLFPVWAGADWQERETFDLVGPVFAGHPDLRRIMLPEDWEGHPLQKQYAIDTPHRPWR